MTIAALRRYGYRVLEAANGAGALTVLRDHAEIDLLFTDMVMPGGMSGLKLATMLKEMKSALKVIIISGYSPEASDSRTPFTKVGTYLSKPIDRLTLLNTVRRSLDEP